MVQDHLSCPEPQLDQPESPLAVQHHVSPGSGHQDMSSWGKGILLPPTALMGDKLLREGREHSSGEVMCRLEAGDGWARGWAASLSLVDWNSRIAEAREKLGPVQIKDHTFLIFKIKETFPTMHAQNGSLDVKRERAPLRSKWCQPTHRPLCWNPSWLRDVHTYTGGHWDHPVRAQNQTSKMTGQRKPRRTPYKSDSN